MPSSVTAVCLGLRDIGFRGLPVILKMGLAGDESLLLGDPLGLLCCENGYVIIYAAVNRVY